MSRIDLNKFKPKKLRHYQKGRSPVVPKGNRETRDNVASFLGTGALRFSYYKNLKNDTDNLLKGRCAYCGVYDDLAVEHYRPKDGIAVNPENVRDISKPGYFWLAADWYNLLPSCSKCNGVKTREVVLDTNYSFRNMIVGKGNRFPLYLDKAHSPLIISDHDRNTGLSIASKKVKREKPLLYNPSRVGFNKIFCFEVVTLVDKNKGIIVLPKPGISDYYNQVAVNTINILGLNSRLKSISRHDVYYSISSKVRYANISIGLGDDEYVEFVNQVVNAIDFDGLSSFIDMIETLLLREVSDLANRLLMVNGGSCREYKNLNEVKLVLRSLMPTL